GGQGNIHLFSNVYPNDTIGRTLLNSPQFVRLEGDKNQVLAWTRYQPNGNVTVLNQMSQNGNLTVGNGTRWRNLNVFEVNGVFIPPGNVSTALTAVGDAPLVSVANQVQVPGSDGSNTSAIEALQQTRGFTLFAPASEAFTSQVNETIQGIQDDPSELLAVFQNHYVNGSTVYSPTLREYAANSTGNDDDGGSPHLTSAAGQYFTFSTNDTGLYVRVSDDTTARIIRPDILTENGVIHLVDTVLLSTDDNSGVASSAYASASSAATESSTDTQAIIFPVPTGGSQMSASEGQSMTSSSMESSATS
ncbi:fasciclin domain-containing protein, partial [Pectobacterium carotovorum subsp. carotovorum]|nr:fasciclin domain-containing protein [Pectobacterium carotovorum subsp. carotovorum]